MNLELQNVNSLLVLQQKDLDGETKQLVSARALHEFLEIKTAFTTWIGRQIEDFDFRLGVDFLSFLEESISGRPKKDFLVTTDMAKELSMLARGEKGKQARKYFIEAEKKLKEVVQKQEPKQIELGEQTAKFFNNLLDDISQHSPTARQTVGANIAKKIYGIELPYTALPPADERFTATQIAKILNDEFDTNQFNYNNVGRLTKQLNLKRPPYAVQRLTVAKHSNKEVPQYHYSPQAIDKIKDYLLK